jgi:hypothetical protein
VSAGEALAIVALVSIGFPLVVVVFVAVQIAVERAVYRFRYRHDPAMLRALKLD